MNSEKSRSVVRNLETMMDADSLRVTQNKDKTFTVEWDKNDPRWAWLNGLTSKEIQIIMQEAIKDYLDDFRQSS